MTPGAAAAPRAPVAPWFTLLAPVLSAFIAPVSAAQAPAAAALVVDQSFVSPGGLSMFINENSAVVAQTFTAGLTGTLSEIRINVASISSFRLHVAIRDVVGGMPGTTILGETTLASGAAPLTLPITFPQTINMVAGTPYAIAVYYEGHPPPGPGQGLGTWGGAAGNHYPGGSIFAGNGFSWPTTYPGYDLHFQTYVDVVTATAPSTWGRLKTLYR